MTETLAAKTFSVRGHLPERCIQCLDDDGNRPLLVDRDYGRKCTTCGAIYATSQMPDRPALPPRPPRTVVQPWGPWIQRTPERIDRSLARFKKLPSRVPRKKRKKEPVVAPVWWGPVAHECGHQKSRLQVPWVDLDDNWDSG